MSINTGKILLLVEDEVILAMSEKMQLEKYSYTVRIAASGEKAIEAMNTYPDINLVLMDINLGNGMDGTEAAEVILRNHDIPIVFVSSHSEREIVEKTEKITSYGYVVKNSSITVLDASIKMAFKLFDARTSEIKKEKALQKSEEKYRLISDNTSDGIVHFSADGVIDYVSPSYLKQLGYPELEEYGKCYDTISPEIHPDDRSALFSSIYDAIEKKKKELTYSYRVKHAKGHFIWREDHSNFLYDSSGTYLGAYSSCRDITDRKNIESKLLVLGKAIDASPAIIIITDAEGKIEYVNPGFTTATGYSSEESIGKNPRFLKSGSTDAKVYEDLWATLTSGNEWRGYFRNRKKSGETYYESATIAPVKNQSGQITNYIAIKEDLTEKRYIQESLEESNIRFNTLAGSQSILIWEAGIDKLCTYFNSTWLSYTGKKLEELLGNGWARDVHPDDYERCLSIYNEAFDKRKEFSMEYRLHKANGTYGWVLDHGSPKYHDNEFLGFLGSCIEITERKSFESILRESEERYRLLHESPGIGIGYYQLDGIIISYNKLAAKHMGGAPEDFIGKSIYDLFPGEEAKTYHDRIKRAAMAEAPVVYEDMVKLPLGNVYFLSTFTRITDLNGTLLGIQIISQDITEQKKTALTLQESIEEFEAVNEELKSTTEELQVQNEELIQSQELLRQSETRLIQAERVAKTGNWTLQLSTRTMVSSEGANAIYGVDFQGVSLAEVQMIPLPEYRPMLDKALTDLIAKNIPYDVKFKICRPNDERIVDIHSVAAFDIRTNTIFGVIQDISEQVQSEEKLRESEENIGNLLNSTAEAIYGIDLEGNCTFCNNACLTLFGYNKKEELLGKDMHWLVHGKHADGSVYPIDDCPISQAFKNGVGTHIDDEVLWHSNGTFFHAEYWSYPQYKNHHLVGAVVSSLDITERKKTEEALRESEQKYKLLAESASDVTWVLDLTTKKFAYISPAIFNLRGLTVEEAMNESMEAAMTQESLQRVMTEIENSISDFMENSDASNHHLTEIQQPCKNGKLIWVEVSTKYRYGNNGTIEVIGVSRNIEERKKLETVTKDLLAEKELILKEVHHRIKNNLNTVISLLSLQAGSISEPKAITALEEAGSRIRSMSVLYDKLYRSADFTEISIKGYLISLVDEVVANFPNSHYVKVKKDIQDFKLDSKRIHSLGIIINELLTNTMKYAFLGRDAGLISISALKVDKQLIISVHDDGVGIPESISFEAAAGFGLRLVYAVTQQLSGTIRIERGTGTRFILEFTL